MMLNAAPIFLRASRTLFLSYISISVTTSIVAQTPLPAASADGNARVRPDIAFDVVSIRPSNAGPDEGLLGTRDLDQYGAIGMPLGWTILVTYFPFRLQSKEQIVGAPGWVWNGNYDF